MPLEATDLKALYSPDVDDIIDVRSPAEFAEDHIPGAINLPALNDRERAEVGEIYVQDSPFRARKIGAAMVARNVATYLDGPLADRPGNWKSLIYCWRGGQRSGSVATILRQIGWRADTLSGGYKSYRRLVLDTVSTRPVPAPVILLDGNTGTAKTEILQRYADAGGQVIDLEHMACHRGSLFGRTGSDQPSQKMFESRLAAALIGLDPARPVLIEAESNRIGALILPAALWRAMRNAPRIEITAPLSARAKYLTTAYDDLVLERSELDRRIRALRPFHSKERIAHWLDLSDAARFEPLAGELMEMHYDPRYTKARSGGGTLVLHRLELTDLSVASQASAAERIAELISGYTPAE